MKIVNVDIKNGHLLATFTEKQIFKKLCEGLSYFDIKRLEFYVNGIKQENPFCFWCPHIIYSENSKNWFLSYFDSPKNTKHEQLICRAVKFCPICGIPRPEGEA